MKTPEKKLAKSNNWETFKEKLKKLGGAGALSLLITLNSCGPEDLDVKKAADDYQNKVQKVETAKKNRKNKQEDLKDAEKDVQKAHQEYIDAQKEEYNAKKETKKESNKL